MDMRRIVEVILGDEAIAKLNNRLDWVHRVVQRRSSVEDDASDARAAIECATKRPLRLGGGHCTALANCKSDTLVAAQSKPIAGFNVARMSLLSRENN